MEKEKIIIDRNEIKKYKSLLIVLENCDVYEIAVEDVLDIYCEAVLNSEKGEFYRAYDGFIKISSRASQTVESWVLRGNEIGRKWDIRLKARLKMCKGAADMVSFSLKDKANQEIEIYVPYDPLEDVMHRSEIELSNCPSFEIDKAGDMIIAFGKSSKQPKRKDNNYDGLIAGWKDAFGDYLPKVLKIKARHLSTFGVKKTNLSLRFKICDKTCKQCFAELVFMDCKDMRMEMFFPENGDCEIVMSKMMDGRIYVGFGLWMDFTCNSVLEYDYYCNRNKQK